MTGRLEHLGEERSLAERLGRPGVAVRLALAWMAGIVAAAQWPWLIAFVVVASAGLLLAGWLGLKGFRQCAWVLGLIGVSCLGGAWMLVQRDYVPRDHIGQYIHARPSLVGLRGTVAGEARDVVPDQQGAFGVFSYEKPGTLFELRLEEADVGRGWGPASGAVLVRLKQHDHRPAFGQRVEVVGWLSAIGPVQNPGEFDYRGYLQRRGVSGRISLVRRGNWKALGDPPRYTVSGVRRAVGGAAVSSLRLGMPDDPPQQALLEALLLGRRAGGMDELDEAFRAVGLSHVLSISGAHLGILLLIVWTLGRLAIGRPGVVAFLVLVVLGLFLLAVPWRTPIIRAAIMAAVFCVGYGAGRRLTGGQVLCAAALIVLVWKPTDLFLAGFQLSFGVVGAILLFARPVSLRLWPEPLVPVVHPTAWDLCVRGFWDFVAVSVVAFGVALPVVMVHFQLISPLAVLLSVLAWPVLTAVLAVGYLKILVGLVSPALGALLAVPMAWVGQSLAGLVEQAQRWALASFTLDRSPSVGWAVVCVAVMVGLFGGVFVGRRRVLVCVVVLVVGWGWWEQRSQSVMAGADRPTLVLNTFAVGDGSCFLIRSGDQAVMFDCGSQGYWRVGERSIVPALKALSVPRLDVLMVSHADMDHFVGVLDVLDGIEVGRVLVSPDVLREAAAAPSRAAGFLVASIRDRGYEPEPIKQGWAMDIGDSRLAILWPEAGYASPKNNNNSLVLSVEAAGRRVLLNGDIQDDAIERLLASEALLHADVTDLAHHGSFVEASPAWLAAVGPEVVLQSCGPRRLENDRWGPLLERQGIKRFATAKSGMIELRVMRDGAMRWSTYRDAEGADVE